MSRALRIADRSVGAGSPCFVVGEVAQAHDGSLGTAHAYIDAIADAGADAVKFQTHLAAAESSPDEPWRVRFSPQDASRFDYWKRMEFSESQWEGLRGHADERGIIFLSSPFAVEAVDLLERVGMPAWKVASGEVANPMLLERIAQTGRPVLLSSGMSSLEELDRAVERLRAAGAPVALLQCTSAYPCPPEQLGLDAMAQLRERYRAPVGLSDHSGTIYAGIAAAALGAELLEVHVTLHRAAFGPDVPASVTVDELRSLVDGVRFVERALAAPADKDAAAASPLREIFGKSIVARADLRAGTLLGAEHLTVRKPGTGIPASRWHEVLGCRLLRDVAADERVPEDAVALGAEIEGSR